MVYIETKIIKKIQRCGYTKYISRVYHQIFSYYIVTLYTYNANTAFPIEHI